MPKKYSEEFKQHAISRAMVSGTPRVAHELGVSTHALNTWIRLKKEEEGIPDKFTPELKEKAVELAQQYGASVTARMLGVSSTSVRNWQRIKAQTGSASAPDPRSHRKRPEPQVQPPEKPQKDAGTQQDPPEYLISSVKWLEAVYEIYAKDPSEDGFIKFKDRIDDYVILWQQEAEN